MSGLRTPCVVDESRAIRLDRLHELEALIGDDPTSSVELAVERAQLLDEFGMVDAAHAAFLAVLGRDATHVRALNAFGSLLARGGFHAAARTAYAQAVATHPNDAMSHGNLASSLLDDGDDEAAQRHYEIALALEPTNRTVHQCLAVLLLRRGDDRAAHHGRIGFAGSVNRWPYRGRGTPISVLVVHSALGGNIPIDRYVDDRTFAKSTLVAEFSDPQMLLPPHALIINAIGDAERCSTGLRTAAALLARAQAPILNAPRSVQLTARRLNARRFAQLPGVVAPRVVRLRRSRLAHGDAEAVLQAAGLRWPLIVRAPGFHTGLHCLRLDHPRDLALLETLPGNDLLAIEFIDVRTHDRLFRKYRVMIVDGLIYPMHLAVSSNWKVHYFTADAVTDPAARSAEDSFLADMYQTLGVEVMDALHAIARRLDLDYAGIDFGIDGRGQVVVFEANATMIVPPAPADASVDRRRAVERIDAAVRRMLLARAASTIVD
jgi:hypothetical protein